MAEAENNVVETINGDCHDFKSLLSASDRDFLVRNNGDQVKLESLKGKKIGLYFSASWCGPCRRFTPKLVEVYSQLSPKGDLEVIFVSADRDEESFNGYFSKMPWLAIPFSDSETRDRLKKLFEVMGIPHLVLLDENGKVSTDEGVEIIQEYGEEGYPFTPERIQELKEAAQTLESILISGDIDFVIGKDGAKVQVTDLVGKTVLLYFSAHWCPPCRAFTPKLVETYEKIKAKDEAFEVVFISSDRDQASFEDYYSGMPWLALPFGDARKPLLSRKFKVRGIPMLITIGPTGKTVTKETRNLIMSHGADAYPFTEERLKEIEAEYEEMAKGWPEKLKHDLHKEHELVLTRRKTFTCDGCDELGQVWSFYCKECDFDLHPKCALQEDKETKADEKEEGNQKEGLVCDGDVCKRV
ncbi:hypothetical protein PTKIN_Ptkin17bG0025000 [Pterospermum kingtungense]